VLCAASIILIESDLIDGPRTVHTAKQPLQLYFLNGYRPTRWNMNEQPARCESKSLTAFLRFRVHLHPSLVAAFVRKVNYKAPFRYTIYIAVLPIAHNKPFWPCEAARRCLLHLSMVTGGL
jgi:hypothetical protein